MIGIIVSSISFTGVQVEILNDHQRVNADSYMHTARVQRKGSSLAVEYCIINCQSKSAYTTEKIEIFQLVGKRRPMEL
jgi:hypothetical protein